MELYEMDCKVDKERIIQYVAAPNMIKAMEVVRHKFNTIEGVPYEVRFIGIRLLSTSLLMDTQIVHG